MVLTGNIEALGKRHSAFALQIGQREQLLTVVRKPADDFGGDRPRAAVIEIIIRLTGSVRDGKRVFEYPSSQSLPAVRRRWRCCGR